MAQYSDLEIRILEQQEVGYPMSNPYNLADFALPLCLTTNIDNFMVEALKHKGLAPRRLGLTWEQSEARAEKTHVGVQLEFEESMDSEDAMNY